jgi:hypothetical protein
MIVKLRLEKFNKLDMISGDFANYWKRENENKWVAIGHKGKKLEKHPTYELLNDDKILLWLFKDICVAITQEEFEKECQET